MQPNWRSARAFYERDESDPEIDYRLSVSAVHSSRLLHLREYLHSLTCYLFEMIVFKDALRDLIDTDERYQVTADHTVRTFLYVRSVYRQLNTK